MAIEFGEPKDPHPGRARHRLPSATHAFVGYLELPRARGRMFYRSRHERDALIHASFDPAVVTIERNDLSAAEEGGRSREGLGMPRRSEPNRVFHLRDGVYTPDLRVQLRDARAPVFVEVGPHQQKAEGPEALRLEEAATEIESHGFRFLVLTDRVMRGWPLENRKRLFGWLHPIAPDLESLVQSANLAFQSSDAGMSVAEVIEVLRAESRDIAPEILEEAVWTAVARAETVGRLIGARDTRLDSGSRLCVLAAGMDSQAMSSTDSLFECLLAGAGPKASPALYVPPIGGDASRVVVAPELVSIGPELGEHRLRLNIIRTRAAEPSLTRAEIAGRFGVSERKVRYWCEKSDHRGEEWLKPRLRKRTGERIAPELKALISKVYVSARKLSVVQVVEHPAVRTLQRELQARGVRSTLSYDQARRFISRELAEDAKVRAIRSGLKRIPPGPAFGVVDHATRIVLPFAQIQVDATVLDNIPVTQRGDVLVRPHLLLAWDVAGHLPAAWRVCAVSPTAIDYLRLIKMVIEPKDQLLRDVGATTPTYPVFGIPTSVLADRGLIFTSETVRRRLEGIGVVPEFTPAYSPWMKGDVERAFRTINQRLLERLPGSTRGSLKERGRRDVVAEASREGLTLDELESAVTLAIVDGIAQDFRSDLRRTALEHYAHLCQTYGPPRRWPTDAQSAIRLRLFALKEEKNLRVRGTRGYEFGTLFYRPQSEDAPSPAKIYFDPDDIRYLAIVDPRTGGFVCTATATDCDLDMPISEQILKATRSRTLSSTNPTGSERLTDVVEKFEQGARLNRRQATVLEAEMRRSRRVHRESTFDHASAIRLGRRGEAPEIQAEMPPQWEENT